MRNQIVSWKLLAVVGFLASCSFPRPDPLPDDAPSIGGNVHGMWTGASGVALRLIADGVDALQTVTANGTFSFTTPLAEGTSYAVAVSSNPSQHTCVIAAGANGVVGPGGATSIDVACTGPTVAINLSAPTPWTLDPTQEAQPTLHASLALQEVALTVTSPDGALRSVQVAGAPLVIGSTSPTYPLPLGTSMFEVAITAQDNSSITYAIPIERGNRLLEQAVYVKASNTDAGDIFGRTIALSGTTLVVGAPDEASGATMVDGNQLDDGADGAGAAYVFQRVGSTWVQRAYLKPSNAAAGHHFGSAVAISGDLIVVGAPDEGSSATGVNGDQTGNAAPGSGAAYVFARLGTGWFQSDYLKASNTTTGLAGRAHFGSAVAVVGNTIAIGAPSEASATSGVNGNQAETSAAEAGAVYVFTYDKKWTQQAYVKASNTNMGDHFGRSVALSTDVLVVGAPGEASTASGSDGDQSNNGAPGAGAAYVFQRSAAIWSQVAYLKASNTETGDQFGDALSISGDTLAVSATFEASSAKAIGGDQTDNSVPGCGAVYLFQRTNSTWLQQAYVKPTNAGGDFGFSLALSSDVLAVGAELEKSAATGINGNQTDTSLFAGGAVYVYRRTGSSWAYDTYVKASNTQFGTQFGISVALSGDTLAVSGIGESSAATGIDGDQTNTNAMLAGAVYLYR